MKRILSLMIAALLLITLSMPAFAEDYKGGDGWGVDFTGDTITANFDSKSIADAMRSLQPGDSVTLAVDVKNSYEKKSHFYMANEVLESLEDNQKAASGGAYTYLLTYKGPDGETDVLYDSDSVGGEDEDGLHGATNSLDEFFYLDTLDPGAHGTVELRVALDGETQGNDYQLAVGRLQMNFAAEKADENTTSTSSTTGRVQTGDDTNVMLWVVLMAVSGAVVVLLIVVAVKDRKKEDDLHE